MSTEQGSKNSPMKGNISSHPNLQIDITCHSGRMGLSGREIDKTGFGLCHSGFWTFLDVFVL